MEHCPDAAGCMLVGHARPFLAMLVTGTPSQAAVDHALQHINEGKPSAKRIKRSIIVSEV